MVNSEMPPPPGRRADVDKMRVVVEAQANLGRDRYRGRHGVPDCATDAAQGLGGFEQHGSAPGFIDGLGGAAKIQVYAWSPQAHRR